MLLNSGIGEGKPGDPICIIAGGLSARVIYITASFQSKLRACRKARIASSSPEMCLRNYVDIAAARQS